MSGTNFYTKELEKTRPYLRKLAAGIKVSDQEKPHLFRDALERMHYFLPVTKYEERWEKREKIAESLNFDSYTNNNNYLIDLYRSKTFYPEKVARQILVLQAISRYPEGIGLDDLEEEIFSFMPSDIPLGKSLEKSLKALCQEKILTYEKKRKVYRLAENPLRGLSGAEVEELLMAIGFYKNMARFSVPGYFLESTLRSMYAPKKKLPFIPAQFRRISMLNIMDEEVLQCILAAINQGRLLKINRHNKTNQEDEELQVLPLRIRETATQGIRQYLQAWPCRDGVWDERSMLFPLESITTAELGKKLDSRPQQEDTPWQQPVELVMRIFYEQEWQRDSMMDEIRVHFKETLTVFHEGEQSCDVTVKTSSPFDVIPLLQANYPDMLLLDGPEEVREKLQENLETVVDYYG